MMRKKPFKCIGIALIICVVVLLSPAMNACEDQDVIQKDTSDCFHEQSSTENLTSSVSLFDYLLERYPLLNEIIDMILQLLYNWLSNLYTGTTFE